MGKTGLFLLLVLTLLLVPALAFATTRIETCSCSVIPNPILIKNSAKTADTFQIVQSGTAASWSTLTKSTLVLKSGESGIIDTFIKPKCGVYGDYSLETRISSTNYEGEISQIIGLRDCSVPVNNTVTSPATQNKGISRSLLIILLFSCAMLLLLLGLLVIYLLSGEGQSYYGRIYLREPRIDASSDRRMAAMLRSILKIIVIVAIIVAIVLFGYYLIRQMPPVTGMVGNASLKNSTNITAKIPAKNISVTALNLSLSNVTAKPTIIGSLKELVLNYAGYVIVGIIILIILISAINRKEL
jgi:hypothetical protein